MQTGQGTPSSKPQEASDLRSGEMPDGMDPQHWAIKQRFLAEGRPWTRDEYIRWNWPAEGDLEALEYWDEDDIPADLRDYEKGGP